MSAQVTSMLSALVDKYSGGRTDREKKIGVPNDDLCSVKLLLAELAHIERVTGLRTGAIRARIMEGTHNSLCCRRKYAYELMDGLRDQWIQQELERRRALAREIEFRKNHPDAASEFLVLMFRSNLDMSAMH